MSLPEQIQKIKGFFRFHEGPLATVLHILLLVGIGAGGYLIGTESRSPEAQSDVSVFSPSSETLPTAKMVEGAETSAGEQGRTAGSFVASAQGTKYHRTDCPGAKSIKEENRVYFETEDAAKKAGYAPAGNCPGLR